jgi:Uma2 family endonuclease
MSTVTRPRVGPADHGRAMTLAEFDELDFEEGYRYELARGVLEVSEVPDDPHGLIVWFLLRLIAAYDHDHPGRIFRAGGGNEFRLHLPRMVSGRHPDVSVAVRGMRKDRRGRRPPSLAFEVVSEGAEARRRDHVTKREEYLAFGLEEYWIVDPIERRVIVLVRDGDDWAERIFAGEEIAEGLVLPGFRAPLPELWAAGEERREDDEPPTD